MRDATINNQPSRSLIRRQAGRLKRRHQIDTRQRRHGRWDKSRERQMEVIMTTTHTSHPAKEVVREYLERRNSEIDPPPTPEEIRRQLGWGLVMFDEKHRARS
jgi:CRISPR/Cas system-associated protein Csm6